MVTEHALRAGSSAITATPLTALDARSSASGLGTGSGGPGRVVGSAGSSLGRALKRLPVAAGRGSQRTGRQCGRSAGAPEC